MLGAHQKIDRRLIHVEDETPVAVAAEDDAAHVSHVVESFPLDFGRRVLHGVCAHSIPHRMGHKPALHRAASCGEQLLEELWQEVGCPQRDSEHVDNDPLLAQLKDVAEQGFLDHLQLAERASKVCLLLALNSLSAMDGRDRPLKN